MEPGPAVSFVAVRRRRIHEISGLVFGFSLSAAPSGNLIMRFRRD